MKILSEVLEDLSGVDVSQADGATSFLEMGFDSLFLTQVTQALQTKFSLKITFRQLLGDLSSMDALSEYIDGKLAADVLAEPVAPTATVPAFVSATPGAPSPVVLPASSPSYASANANGDSVMP